jgi:hypothetical protein
MSKGKPKAATAAAIFIIRGAAFYGASFPFPGGESSRFCADLTTLSVKDSDDIALLIKARAGASRSFHSVQFVLSLIPTYQHDDPSASYTVPCRPLTNNHAPCLPSRRRCGRLK